MTFRLWRCLSVHLHLVLIVLLCVTYLSQKYFSKVEEVFEGVMESAKREYPVAQVPIISILISILIVISIISVTVTVFIVIIKRHLQ